MRRGEPGSSYVLVMDANSSPQKHRPHRRGDRSGFTVRMPVELKQELEDRAGSAGVPLGSFIIQAICEAENLEVPDYIVKELQKAKLRRGFDSEGASLLRIA